MRIRFDRPYLGTDIVAAFKKAFESIGDGKTTRWKISEDKHNFQLEVGRGHDIVIAGEHVYQSISALPERLIFTTPFGGKVWRFDVVDWEGFGWIRLNPIIAEKEYQEIEFSFAGVTAAEEESQYLGKKLPAVKNIVLALYENLLKASVKNAA